VIANPIFPVRFFEVGDGGAPGALSKGSCFKRFHERTFLQEGVNNRSLNASAFSVNDPDPAEPLLLTFQEVFF